MCGVGGCFHSCCIAFLICLTRTMTFKTSEAVWNYKQNMFSIIESEKKRFDVKYKKRKFSKNMYMPSVALLTDWRTKYTGYISHSRIV